HLIERHESLRTNFYEIDHVPYQSIHNSSEKVFKINFIDVSELQEEKSTNEVTQLLKKEATYIFDIENDSLFRFTLIKINSTEHIISFTFHHIITDGWSINLLLKEFTEIYYSLENNINQTLPNLELQYADYSIWQREYLEGEVLDNQLKYWSKKLGGIPPVLELPIDKPKPKLKTFNGSKVVVNLPASVKEDILQTASEEGATLFMILLSVYNILLSKYSGQKDIAVGTPIANRTQLETEQIAGFFANTLVFRNNLFGDPTFKELLSRVKETSLDAYSNQDVPFEKLVELIQPDRDLSHSPLFQVMFVLQNNPTSSSENGNLKIEPIENHFSFTQYELTLSAEESIDGLTLWMEYNTDLFKRTSIEIMLERFVNILTNVIEEPNKNISQVGLIREPETNRFIEQLSRGKETKYEEKHVIELFEKIVNSRSTEIAIINENEKITYSDLNKKSNQIANYLLTLNVKREEVIAVMLPRSIDMIASIVGIMKSDCTYLPIDPSYPEERKKYMLENSGAKILLSENPALNIHEVKNIFLDDMNLSIFESQSDFSNVKILEDNLAYMIYTSGSTGQPKGVMLTHKGLLNLVKNQIRDFGVNENSRVLQFASLSFDASVSEIFMALLSGARLYLENNDRLKDKNELTKNINDNSITTITLPPSLLSILKIDDLHEVETIISAGEILSKQVAKKWKDEKRLINAYGPTESTVGVSSYLVENIDELNKSIPIGSSIDNVSIYILDEGLNLLPNGIVGEIYLGGVGLARGYKDNYGKTAEVFIPNPFSKYGERLYRTGDTGKLNNLGYVEYVERVDSQVKVRGYRIELGEIESNLKSINGILDAVVDVRAKSNNKILVGYLQIEKEFKLNIEEIKTELKEKLTEYMIPNIFVEINEIPKSLSGKIDRKKLPDFESSMIVSENKFISPRNETEEILVAIWKQLLGLEKISITDNFFEIGGHSLLAIQLIGKIDFEFNIELEMVQLFQEPTIASLSSEILRENTQVEDTSKVLVNFTQVEDTNPIFFIHPSGGSVHWYTLLSREFANIRSFFGLKAIGIGGRVEPQTTIEEMAATYIKAIKELRPNGPYIIGSWSMGVVIAYEVAYQLAQKGEKVDPLIILDQGPIIPNDEPEDTAEFLSRMFMGRTEFNLDELRKLSYDDQLKTVLKKAKKERQFPKFISLKRFKTYVKILKIQQDAWRNYKIPKYTGDIILIKSKDSNYDYYNTEEFGWEKFVSGKINIHTTDGDHNTMLHDPNVKKLAELLNKII
ncbi:MAG: amino acid adenylation domain-containing protein, partial [Ignavibacteriae bacterium]|nr:amino acid adenylation domain-containing protein [Ignavibacteriota bacterium]